MRRCSRSSMACGRGSSCAPRLRRLTRPNGVSAASRATRPRFGICAVRVRRSPRPPRSHQVGTVRAGLWSVARHRLRGCATARAAGGVVLRRAGGGAGRWTRRREEPGGPAGARRRRAGAPDVPMANVAVGRGRRRGDVSGGCPCRQVRRVESWRRLAQQALARGQVRCAGRQTRIRPRPAECGHLGRRRTRTGRGRRGPERWSCHGLAADGASRSPRAVPARQPGRERRYRAVPSGRLGRRAAGRALRTDATRTQRAVGSRRRVGVACGDMRLLPQAAVSAWTGLRRRHHRR